MSDDKKVRTIEVKDTIGFGMALEIMRKRRTILFDIDAREAHSIDKEDMVAKVGALLGDDVMH